jgi:hypothetical protein
MHTVRGGQAAELRQHQGSGEGSGSGTSPPLRRAVGALVQKIPPSPSPCCAHLFGQASGPQHIRKT